MNHLNPNFTAVTFSEVPDCAGNVLNDFVVSVDNPLNQNQYSISLFNKILIIGLSEFSGFLSFNCTHAKKPGAWLNSLEKLIKLNVEHFSDSQLRHRHTKLISEIGLMRHTLQHTKRENRKKLNGFSDEKEYSFTQVKEHLASLQTTEEKILYLNNQIFDYRQTPPDFVSLRHQPFDHQCELEIERLKEQDRIMNQLNQNKNARKQGDKMPVHGELKVLCDVFYQLIFKPLPNGTTFLTWSIMETANFICNSFCNPDGSSLNHETVRVYLSPSKDESRVKPEKRIKIL